MWLQYNQSDVKKGKMSYNINILLLLLPELLNMATIKGGKPGDPVQMFSGSWMGLNPSASNVDNSAV